MKHKPARRNDGLTATERALVERLMDAIETDIAAYLAPIAERSIALMERLDALEATVIALDKRVNRMAQAVGE